MGKSRIGRGQKRLKSLSAQSGQHGQIAVSLFRRLSQRDGYEIRRIRHRVRSFLRTGGKGQTAAGKHHKFGKHECLRVTVIGSRSSS